MTSERSRGWWRRPVLVATAIIVVLAISYVILMNIGFSRRVGVPIHDSWLIAPDHLMIIVDTCTGEPEVTVLRESVDAVEVRIVSTKTWGSGKDCLDSVDIRLDEPLGNRTLFDLTGGKPVELGTPLWG